MDNFEPRAPGRSTLPRLRITLLGVAMLAFGLLIWSRLLLVTNYPKTAIADPPAAAEEQASHAAEAHERPTLR